MIIAVLAFVLCSYRGCQSKEMEAFVVEGEFSKISNFPHSTYLESFCGKKKVSQCGGSIVNQQIILTAAHCMPRKCSQPQHIKARFGNENKTNGIKMKASKYIVHENYTETNVAFDIALMLLNESVVFSKNIARVAISKEPVPGDVIGTIAGWGYIDEDGGKTDLLMHTHQKVITREICEETLGRLPEGVFCAFDVKGKSYPTNGDSGSAFVINHYIQVGIVSYKLPWHPTIIVYTDTFYYYNWIREHALKLHCSHGPNIINIT